MNGIWENATEALMTLPGYLLDANKRVFWLYLLGALVLSIPVFIHRYRGFSLKGFLRFVFHPRIWGHPSARLDYWLFFTNRLIRVLLLTPVVLTMVPVAMGLSSALEQVFGVIYPVSEQPWVVIGVFTLILFLFDDFSRFVLHYALHKVPFLWDFHKVHHSARVLTPMTIYRSHPVEIYLYASRMALAQGCAVGVGYFLFGPTLSMFDILGANAFVFGFNVLGSNLRHSHVWMPWGDRLEKIFISPAMHQIHHSDRPEHFDRNLGTALAIWDRLCGTHVYSSGIRRLRFGVGGKDPGHSNLYQVYGLPFVQNWQRLKSFWQKYRAPGIRLED